MLKLFLLLFSLISLSASDLTLAQTDIHSNFKQIDLKRLLPNQPNSFTSPKALALQLFGNDQDREGRKSEEISIEYLTSDTAVIVETLVGLADDSVGGIRYRIELELRQNKWQIVWVGQQTKCQPDRGHQDWSVELCS